MLIEASNLLRDMRRTLYRAEHDIECHGDFSKQTNGQLMGLISRLANLKALLETSEKEATTESLDI
jgi:hypothetical protein